jgi:hypothetical protein
MQILSTNVLETTIRCVRPDLVACGLDAKSFQDPTNQAKTHQGLPIGAASMVVKGEIKDERTKYPSQAEVDDRKRIGWTTSERIPSV